MRPILSAGPRFTKRVAVSGVTRWGAREIKLAAGRGQHRFIGSGVIEAGCKTVIGCRLKQSGVFWTIRGANAIIALGAMLPSQWSLRDLLGGASGSMTSTFMSRTQTKTQLSRLLKLAEDGETVQIRTAPQLYSPNYLK